MPAQINGEEGHTYTITGDDISVTSSTTDSAVKLENVESISVEVSVTATDVGCAVDASNSSLDIDAEEINVSNSNPDSYGELYAYGVYFKDEDGGNSLTIGGTSVSTTASGTDSNLDQMKVSGIQLYNESDESDESGAQDTVSITLTEGVDVSVSSSVDFSGSYFAGNIVEGIRIEGDVTGAVNSDITVSAEDTSAGGRTSEVIGLILVDSEIEEQKGDIAITATSQNGNVLEICAIAVHADEGNASITSEGDIAVTATTENGDVSAVTGYIAASYSNEYTATLEHTGDVTVNVECEENHMMLGVYAAGTGTIVDQTGDVTVNFTGDRSNGVSGVYEEGATMNVEGSISTTAITNGTMIAGVLASDSTVTVTPGDEDSNQIVVKAEGEENKAYAVLAAESNATIEAENVIVNAAGDYSAASGIYAVYGSSAAVEGSVQSISSGEGSTAYGIQADGSTVGVEGSVSVSNTDGIGAYGVIAYGDTTVTVTEGLDVSADSEAVGVIISEDSNTGDEPLVVIDGGIVVSTTDAAAGDGFLDNTAYAVQAYAGEVDVTDYAYGNVFTAGGDVVIDGELHGQIGMIDYGDGSGEVTVFEVTTENGYDDALADYEETYGDDVTPGLTADQVAELVHYIIRVKEGQESVISYSGELIETITSEIGDFDTVLEGETFSVTVANGKKLKVKHGEIEKNEDGTFTVTALRGGGLLLSYENASSSFIKVIFDGNVIFEDGKAVLTGTVKASSKVFAREQLSGACLFVNGERLSGLISAEYEGDDYVMTFNGFKIIYGADMSIKLEIDTVAEGENTISLKVKNGQQFKQSFDNAPEA